MDPIIETDKLYVADCLPFLRTFPDNAVDVVITSPPYNQLGSKRARVKGWSSSPGMFEGRKIQKYDGDWDDDMPEEEYQSWLQSVIEECIRVCKGLVWINHKVRYRNNLAIHPLRFLHFPLYAEVIWARNGSLALNCKRFAPSHEAIYAFGKRQYWDDSYNHLLSVWNIAACHNDFHPCSFPVEIPLRLILVSCPPDGIVLDPFAGACTTCLAAAKADRRYIGIDINERYIALGRERIEEETRQLQLDLSEARKE
jgi:DNA modification methylase